MMIKFIGNLMGLIFFTIYEVLGFFLMPLLVVGMVGFMIWFVLVFPFSLILMIFDINIYSDIFGLLPDTFWKYGTIVFIVGGYLYAFTNPTISGISKTKGACITSPINIAKQRKASSPWYLVNFILLSICSTVKFE